MNYKRFLIDACLRMVKSGLTVETWGNISVRDPESGYIYLTPSGMAYETLVEDDIVVMDVDGNRIEGERKPTIEHAMHLGIMKNRPDVNAIVHTHPVYSQVFALLHEDIPPVIDEAAQTLGNVKVTEYALPGSPEMAQNAIEAIGKEGSACLLANHGAVAVGKDMDTAFKVYTVLEMTAQIYYMARCIGKPMPIDAEKIAFMKEFVSKSYGQK
ncbi:MAG: class II aldolase/adducin family protein [Oscillospiraceae bacterium]|nr:class II aldolase/adducin family protein [Oscillospiraceae bacterium]